jgi:hypothetical protein
MAYIQPRPEPGSFTKGFFGAWGACAGCIALVVIIGFLMLAFFLFAFEGGARQRQKDKEKARQQKTQIAVPPTAATP